MTAPAEPAAPWRRRLERAADLRRRWPFAHEVLDLFIAVTEFQSSVSARLPDALPEDPGFLAAFLPELAAIVATRGPPVLAAAAAEWRVEPEWIASSLSASWRRQEECGSAREFFLRVVLQPYAMALGRSRRDERRADRSPPAAAGSCPDCGRPPALGILREDASAAASLRRLACGLCDGEWTCPRLDCPACGEASPAKLPRYSAEEIPWIRIEACDGCGTYLKCVDLTKEAAAVPVVDEIASTPLDVIARERGYTKLAPNLAGI